ncbi:MAG: NAD-dependent epimerase/dehydratase family protein [Firmicutes bacterium]|nr:NAD-dependent epimerase/dehydratase family protein [Bacillota bacterium]
MKQLNWLITGGCGFIGTSLIQDIISSNPNANIRILDNLSVGTVEDLSEVCSFNQIRHTQITESPCGCELIEGDIRDSQITEDVCKGIDVIVHLAANTGVAPSVENPRQDCENNVIGILNMLEGARQHSVNKFIFASSGAPLGEQEPPIHEEKVPRPVSPYGASKLAGEAYCSAYYRTFGVKTVALRFGNVYGPRSKHKSSVVAKFIKEALAGETLEIYGDGGQTRDFIYIKDLISAIMLSVQNDVGGEVFQIATYKETTVNELTKQLIKNLKEYYPNLNVRVIYGENRLGDVRRNYSDITKAKTILGFEPQYDLNKGLKATIEWFKETSGLR